MGGGANSDPLGSLVLFSFKLCVRVEILSKFWNWVEGWVYTCLILVLV